LLFEFIIFLHHGVLLCINKVTLLGDVKCISALTWGTTRAQPFRGVTSG